MFYFAFKEDFCYNLFEVSNTSLKMVFLTGKKKKKKILETLPLTVSASDLSVSQLHF